MIILATVKHTGIPGAPTSLSLFNFTDYGGLTPYQYTFRNVTASEHCIYRQYPAFVQVIADVFAIELFNGSCFEYPEALQCAKEDGTMAYTFGNLGVGAVLTALYNDGSNTNSNITQWFNSFADAMTNRFRSQYGTARASLDISKLPAPPLDVIHGTAWQADICVLLR